MNMDDIAEFIGTVVVTFFALLATIGILTLFAKMLWSFAWPIIRFVWGLW